jgi:hypothetical protein
MISHHSFSLIANGSQTESLHMASSRISSSEGQATPAMTDGLVDEMLAYYIDWRHDAAAAEDAYRLWSIAPTDEEALRYAAYVAALDQEESSAIRYALVFREVERAVQCDASVSNPFE